MLSNSIRLSLNQIYLCSKNRLSFTIWIVSPEKLLLVVLFRLLLGFSHQKWQFNKFSRISISFWTEKAKNIWRFTLSWLKIEYRFDLFHQIGRQFWTCRRYFIIIMVNSLLLSEFDTPKKQQIAKNIYWFSIFQVISFPNYRVELFDKDRNQFFSYL